MPVVDIGGSVETATLEQVRRWPATVSVAEAASALGVSRPHAYNSIRRGDFPARVIQVGTKRRVVTADLRALLESERRAA